MAKKLTAKKAKEILRHGEVHGESLTARQKRYMGYVAGGGSPKAQTGGWMDSYLSDGFMQPNDPKLPAGYKIPNRIRSSELSTSVGGERGEPAYLIPSFKRGKPLENPLQEYRETGEHLGGPFKTWQEADKWEREVRHPYVEKGQNIPSPLKTWGEGYKNGGWLDKYQDGGEVKDSDPIYGDIYTGLSDVEARELHESLYKDYLNKKRGTDVKEFQSEIRQNTNKFAQDYIVPTIKTAASFTPAGPAIGLTDAYWAAKRGDTAGAAIMAGAEALPYGLKYAGKGVKSLLKNKKVSKELTKEANKFISEIDWKKWNPDTPKHKVLMDEYNAIEEGTKKAGTWMKNPDGSVFQGTPEQFVQQQSSYFKKAYPEGASKTYRGVTRLNRDIPENKAIFTGNKELAEEYTQKGRNKLITSLKKRNKGGIYELYNKNSSKSLSFDAQDRPWDYLDLSDDASSLKRRLSDYKTRLKDLINNKDVGDSEKIKELKKLIFKTERRFDNLVSDQKEFNKLRQSIGNGVTTNDIASYLETTDLDNIELRNIIDDVAGDVNIINNKKGNYLKSTYGNVGFFDMTNPNIYKTLVPASIGAKALTGNKEEYKNGGQLKKYQDGGEVTSSYYNTNEEGVINAGPYTGLTLDEASELNKLQHTDYLSEKRSSDVEAFQSKIRKSTSDVAQRYINPAIKTAASFTPAGPAIGLTDAYWALQGGDKLGAALMAGAEALPYGLKYAGKGVKTLLKNKKAARKILGRFPIEDYHAKKYNTNPDPYEVLEQMRGRIKTPEGQRRLIDYDTWYSTEGKISTDPLRNIDIIEDPTTYGKYRRSIFGQKIGLNPSLPYRSLKNVTRHELEHAIQKGRPTAIDDLLEGLELRKQPQPLVAKTKTSDIINANDLEVALQNKQRAVDYFTFGSEGREKSAMLAELQQYLADNKLISHPYASNEITPKKIKEVFMNKIGKGDYPLRIFDIMKPSEKNYKLISEGLNKMLSVAPVIGAGKLTKEKNNEERLDSYQDGGELTPKQFTSQYIQSPKYRERLESSGYDADDEMQMRLSNIMKTRSYNQYGVPSRGVRARFDESGRPYTRGGSSYLPQSDAVVIDLKQAEEKGINPDYIGAHEFGHAETATRGEYDEVTGIRKSRLNPRDVQSITDRLGEGANPIFRKVPDEIKSDLGGLRYELYDKGIYDAGTEDFDLQHLQQLDDSYIKNRLLKNYSEEDLIWLMNNIAMDKKATGKVSARSGKRLKKSQKLTNFTDYDSGWLNKYS